MSSDSTTQRGRRLAVGAACTAAIATVAWPLHSVAPGVSADWEWIAGLYYAGHHGLRFGGEIAWTYGPLGFLNAWYGPALYYGDLLMWSWSFVALVQVLLAAALLVLLRRSLPLLLAVPAAVVVLALVPDRPLALGFCWCVLMLTRPDEPRPGVVSRALPLALGALTGVALLGKLNQGVELAALAAIALAARPRRRDALALCGALVATALAGWLASGQALGDVWPYLRNGVEVVAGYPAAMGTTDPAHRWTFAAALALALLAFALAWDPGRETAPRRRWGLLGLCVVYVAFAFKEGFVRQDVGHMKVFFGDMILVLAILPPRPTRSAVVIASVAAGVVAFALLAGAREVTGALDPYANARAAADQVRTLASRARQERVTADLRARIAAVYQLSPKVLAAVGRRPVMPWPFLVGDAVYAYDLNLRPLPSLQAYNAFTPALDRLSASMLTSPRAPDRILRQPGFAPDGRNPAFEAPLSTLAILCRYRQIAVASRWQVLARSADRCGRTRTLRTTTAAWGAEVAVPQPRRAGAVVLVQILGADPRGLERVKALLLRPSRRWIALDGAQYRLVAATAPDGLLLRVPRGADFRDDFAMAPNPSRIAVGRDDGQPSGQLRYVFVELPIGRSPGRPSRPS